MNRNKRLNIGLFINAISLLLILGLSFYMTTYEYYLPPKEVDVYQVVLLVVVVIFVLTNLFVRNKFTEPIMVLFITLVIFGLGRIILDLFGYGNFSKLTWFASYRVRSIVQFKVLMCFAITLLSLNVGYFTYERIFKYNDKYEEDFNFKSDNKLYKISLVLFLIFLVPFIYKNLFIGYQVLTKGYAYMYSGEMVIPGGSIINLSAYMFKFSFYMLLASLPSRRKLIIPFLIYLVTMGISLLTGVRGLVLAEGIVLITYLGYRKDFKISFVKLGVIGVLTILLAFFVGNLRGVSDEDSNKNTIEPNFIVKFIEEQGFSLNVLSIAIDKQLALDAGIGYLVHPVFFGDFGKFIVHKFEDPQMYGVLTHSLPHEISYLVNEKIYREGYGMGGNYLAELYLIMGLPTVLIGNLIIGWCLALLKNKMLNNKYVLYFALYMLPYIYFMPRNYTLGFMEIILRPIVFLGGVIFLRKYLVKDNNETVFFKRK